MIFCSSSICLPSAIWVIWTSDAFGVSIIKIEDRFDDLFVSDSWIFGHDFVDAADDAFVTQKSGERGEAFHAFLSRR